MAVEQALQQGGPAGATPNRTRSREEFRRAQAVLPGGVNSPARAFGAVGGEPLVIRKGDGCYLWDVDGNQLIDFVGSWGPHLLGHRHPAVMAAIEDALQYGTSFGAPSVYEAELAELVIAAVPSIEMVRMVNSGTEAAMSVLRLARGFTGRDKIVKFAGCYHGHVDSLLVQAGSGALTHGVPNSPGVPAGCTNDTLVLGYNDPQGLEELFGKRGGEIAAVILELVCGNMGVVVPTAEFLTTARRLCDEHGALLIADEVMTGFRVAYGGAQSLLGVRPDLTMLGKVIGGGMPVGAYGGRADVMRHVSPLGPVYQAGTLSGNPVAMACGIATLTTLRDENPYPRLDAQSARLCAGLSAAASARGLPHSLARVGSMFTLFFTPERVTNYPAARTCDTARFGRYFWGMLDRGVYLPCSQFEANFVSASHTDEVIAQTLAAATAVFAELAAD